MGIVVPKPVLPGDPAEITSRTSDVAHSRRSLPAVVVALYFRYNPMNHSRWFILRRFINWFPLGMTYASCTWAVQSERCQKRVGGA